MQPFICIANWKMNKSLSQSLSFFQDHCSQLNALAQTPEYELVFCPSAEAIASLRNINNTIPLGAQDCSSFDCGPYTGQISAQSLKQAGCTYCIIGHSERRRMCGDTDTLIAQKAARLFEHGICPIICIGETSQERTQGTTNTILAQQVSPLMQILSASDAPFIIAYEPIWAIGSGMTPNALSLSAVFTHLTTILSHSIERSRYRLIYGGSVNEKTASELITIKPIQGFLIGDASLDFQKLQKIVLLRP